MTAYNESYHHSFQSDFSPLLYHLQMIVMLLWCNFLMPELVKMLSSVHQDQVSLMRTWFSIVKIVYFSLIQLGWVWLCLSEKTKAIFQRFLFHAHSLKAYLTKVIGAVVDFNHLQLFSIFYQTISWNTGWILMKLARNIHYMALYNWLNICTNLNWYGHHDPLKVENSNSNNSANNVYFVLKSGGVLDESNLHHELQMIHIVHNLTVL